MNQLKREILAIPGVNAITVKPASDCMGYVGRPSEVTAELFRNSPRKRRVTIDTDEGTYQFTFGRAFSACHYAKDYPNASRFRLRYPGKDERTHPIHERILETIYQRNKIGMEETWHAMPTLVLP